MSKVTDLSALVTEIEACTVCQEHLPLGPRPVFTVSKSSRILIIGQAPGKRVHESGIPWDDPSGVRLREWMGISNDEFYDATKIALMPMGFCFPGSGSSGDLPPRKECAPLWHAPLLSHMKRVELTLLIGQYSQREYLGDQRQTNLTETVRAWETHAPDSLPLPHPSPRNNRWIKQNPWFAEDVLPYLQDRVQTLLS